MRNFALIAGALLLCAQVALAELTETEIPNVKAEVVELRTSGGVTITAWLPMLPSSVQAFGVELDSSIARNIVLGFFLPSDPRITQALRNRPAARRLRGPVRAASPWRANPAG